MIPTDIEFEVLAKDKLERLHAEAKAGSVLPQPLRSRLAVWLVQLAARLDKEAIRSESLREARA